MVPEDLRIYSNEIARILRQGGMLFVTGWVEQGVPPVSFNPPGYAPFQYSGPLHVVRYEQQFLFSIFNAAGLKIVEFVHQDASLEKHSEIYLVKGPGSPGGVAP